MTGRGRGKEVALQVEVESQEEWEELISKEGLTVIDVYQEWCGPCKAMVSNFKRFKNEIGDELLRFAVAKADSIEALERYRGKCEPCFLFYAGGLLVDVIRGANSPQLLKKMIYQLAYEHKVLEGQAERKEIRDPNLPHREDKHGAKAAVDAEESDEEDSSDEEEDETRDENGLKFGGENIMFESLPQKADIKQVYLERMFTVGIIKPDIYADGKTDEIIDKIRESGFDVLEQMERIFAPEEVQELYSSMREEENFQEIIKDMCNGPSIILVLSKGQYGEGIIEEWHEFLGPQLISEAKEQAPKSLRAIYCTPGQPHSDGFHGSSSLEAAKRELRLFFPDFVVPKLSITHIRPQMKPTTIAIIRPAALESFRAEILERIAADHFKIELQREMQMPRSEAEKFYKENKGEPFFEELLDNMASGPMLVMALSALENVVEKWRSLLGSKDVEQAAVLEPDSFRGKYAVRGVNVNQFHGSDTEEQAHKEFDYFFPIEQTLLVIKPHAFYSRDAIIHKVSQAGFRVVARKEMELSDDQVKALYRNCEHKEFYNDLASSMKKGATTFLILSKPNAVSDWRSFAGPTDPEVAREEAPQTIRALFGKDILRNAVHSPATLVAAKEEITEIFGDVEFDADGSLKKKKKAKKRKSSEEMITRHPGPPPIADKTVVTRDDADKPAAMAAPDKYDKEKQEMGEAKRVVTADNLSVFASADSQQEDIAKTPAKVLLHDEIADMPEEDSQAEDLDAVDVDARAQMGKLDDQSEDLRLKKGLEKRLVEEERPPARWGVEVEVPLEDATAVLPFAEDIQLEVSPEVSWVEHLREQARQAELQREMEREMERQAELQQEMEREMERQGELQREMQQEMEMEETQRVQEVMDESISVKEEMAAEGTVPELLAEEAPVPEHIVSLDTLVPEAPGSTELDERTESEQEMEKEMAETQRVQEVMDESIAVKEEMAAEGTVPELLAEEEPIPEYIVPPEPSVQEISVPPESSVPQEWDGRTESERVQEVMDESIVVHEEMAAEGTVPELLAEESPVPEHIVPPDIPEPEEPVVPSEEQEEDQETSYPMADCARNEIEGLPKEEEPADLPDPDLNEHIEEGEELGDDGEKESPRQGQGEHSEEEHDPGDTEARDEGRKDEDAEEHKHSQEHLNSEEQTGSQHQLDALEHKESQGSQQHLDAQERPGSQGSQHQLDAKEHTGSQQHLDAPEHKESQGSQQHLDANEHTGSQQHLEAQEHKESQGSQQHLDAQERPGSQGSQHQLDAKEHTGSQQHLEALEHKESQGSQQHLDAKEHAGSQGSQHQLDAKEPIDSEEQNISKEHKDSDDKTEQQEDEQNKEDAERNNEIHSQKDDADGDSKPEGDKEDEHKGQ